MNRIDDAVKFNEKALFDGAVQIDWLYDKSKNEAVSLSYVFHGPKYHGVNNGKNEYSLIDTASFVNDINSKLYIEDTSNRFILAISSYGTGKSHLSVALANLFSKGKDNQLSNGIIKGVKDADEKIGKEIELNIGKKNLIIAINGMKDANLNSLVLRAAKLALINEGLSDEILNDASIGFNKAKEFLLRSFEKNSEKYIDLLNNEIGISLNEEETQNYILDNMEDKPEIFEIINEVYYDLTGSSIENDGAFSVGEILTTLYNKLIVDKKIFNKIVIIFDEFGRFIEYAANYPKASGDSALQQIYESIQNSNGNMLFIGFIQYDIETYIARVVNNPNISKYIGRYKNAEKKYLSSNLETIFANVLVKNTDIYTKFIKNALETGYKLELEKEHKNMKRWIKSMLNKEVWNNHNMYNRVIVQGCYPFHPLSIWLLTHLSIWMQERSTINYLKLSYDSFKNEEINKEYLRFIYPCEIISESFIKELKGAEDRGLQQSIFCNLYYNIEVQLKNRINFDEIYILKAVLIINILGIKPYDKEDLYLAIQYCTGFTNKKIKEVVISLENTYGVVEFNPDTNVYDFSIEANGFSEFNKKMIIKRKKRSNIDLIELIGKDENIKDIFQLNTSQETDFGFNFISSTEWKYTKSIQTIEEINESLLKYYIDEVTNYRGIDNNRGRIIFVYINTENYVHIESLRIRIKELGIDDLPIIFKIVEDKDNKLYEFLNSYFLLMSFSISERERFSKFFNKEIEKTKKSISKHFTMAISKNLYLTQDGIKDDIGDSKKACFIRFKKIYYNAIPFKFDGFEKNSKSQAVKTHIDIFRNIVIGEYKNKKLSDILSSDIYNRMTSVFGKNIYSSWEAINEQGYLEKPKYKDIEKIFLKIEKTLEVNNDFIMGSKIFKEYLLAPYGMNEYSLTMLIGIFIYCYSGRIVLGVNDNKISKKQFIDYVIDKKKIMLDRIFKVGFSLLEEDKEEILDKIIKEGNLIRDREECADFLIKYEEKILQYDLDDSYNEKIDFILKKIRDGKLKNENIIEKINLFSFLLEDYKKKNGSKSMEGLITISDLISCAHNISKLGNSDNIFGFDKDKRIKSINHELLILLKDIKDYELENTLLSQNYIDYKAFYREKNVYEKLIRAFNSINFHQLSQIIKITLEKIELYLDLQEKNRKIIEEIEAFIKLNKNLDNRSILDLLNIKDEILKKIDCIKYEKIEEVIIKKINDNLSILLNKVNLIIDSIKDSLIMKIKKLYATSSLEEIKKSMEEIKKVYRVLDDKVLSNNYFKFEKDFKFLQKSLSEIYSFSRRELEEFKLKELIEFEQFGFYSIVNESVERKNQDLLKQEHEWYNKNILALKENYESTPIKELYRYRRELEGYPNYISEPTIKEIVEFLIKINNTIKEKNLDGVFELFIGLERDQQIKLLYKIQKYLNII